MSASSFLDSDFPSVPSSAPPSAFSSLVSTQPPFSRKDFSSPACAAFKKHLQFFRHCVLDFTGQPELGLERDEAAVQRALQRINQMTADRLLKPSIAKSFAFEDFVAANQFMETCPAGGRVVMTLES